MKQRVPVSQIMSKDIVTIDPTNTLYEAEALFKKHHIRHIPVVEGRKLVGVLSLQTYCESVLLTFPMTRSMWIV